MAMDGDLRASRKSSSYRGVSRTSRNAWGVKYSGKRIKSTCRTEQEAARLYDEYLREHQPEKYAKLANFCPQCDADRMQVVCRCDVVGHHTTYSHKGSQFRQGQSSTPIAARQAQSTSVTPPVADTNTTHGNSRHPPSAQCSPPLSLPLGFHQRETSPSSVVMATPDVVGLVNGIPPQSPSDDVDMSGGSTGTSGDDEGFELECAQSGRFSLTDKTDFDRYEEDCHSTRKRSFSESALQSEMGMHVEQRGAASLDHASQQSSQSDFVGFPDLAVGKSNDGFEPSHFHENHTAMHEHGGHANFNSPQPNHMSRLLSAGSKFFDCGAEYSVNSTDPAFFAAKALISLHHGIRS